MSTSLISVICICDIPASQLKNKLTFFLSSVEKIFPLLDIIIVNNASHDHSADIIKSMLHDHSNVRMISLAHHCPIDTAMLAGIEHCIGDYALTVSLQELPLELFPVLLRHCQDENCDIVQVKWSGQKISLLYRACSSIFYRFLEFCTGERISNGLSNVCCMNRRIINALIADKSNVPFLRYTAALAGYRQKIIEYPLGKRKYHLGRRILYGWERIIATSDMLLHACAAFSLILGMLNCGYAMFAMLSWLLDGNIQNGWTSTSMLITGMFSALFLILAVLCEYLSIIFKETKRGKLYHIAEDIDSSSSISIDTLKKNVVS